jgi:hypothetical protein
MMGGMAGNYDTFNVTVMLWLSAAEPEVNVPVTFRLYVPVGVPWLLPETGPPRPQLASARASKSPNARGSIRHLARRRLDAIRAQATQTISMASASKTLGPCKRGGRRVRGEVTEGAVVVTRSINCVPGLTAEGDIVQLAAVGMPPQVRATDWLNPDSALTISL